MTKANFSTQMENILSKVGNPGKAQLFLWLLLLYNIINVLMVQQFNVLISYVPPHRCKTQPPVYQSYSGLIPWVQDFAVIDYDSLYKINNGSHVELKAVNISLTSDSSCFVYINPENETEGITPCKDGWDFDTIAGEIYPAIEFGLVCDLEYLLHLELSITYTGVMLGGLLFGIITDRFGRKLTMSFVVTLMSICSISIYFSKDFISFVIIRFFLGMLTQGFHMTILTYNAELFRGKMRTITSSSFGVMSALLLPTQGSLFYFLGDWRKVHLLMGILSSVSALYTWFLPESVVWLLTNHRVPEAERILKSFAKINHISLDDDIHEELEEVAEELRLKKMAEKPRWSDLFRSRLMRRIMLSLLILCFFEYCITSGLSLSISTLSGNLYINYIINGSIQLFLQVFSLIFFVKCGRVKIFSSLLFSTGLTGIGGYFMKHYAKDSGYSSVATIMALLSRNLMSVGVNMMPMFTSELIPTNLRSTGLGFTFTASRLGNAVSPQMLFFMGQIWNVLPQIMFGFLALIGGGIILFLPETLNRPLPQNIQDVEEMRYWSETSESTPLLRPTSREQQSSLEERMHSVIEVFHQMPVLSNAITTKFS